MSLVTMTSVYVYPQRIADSEKKITASDLESYVSFLASPLLKGRKDGDDGLEIAAQPKPLPDKLTNFILLLQGRNT